MTRLFLVRHGQTTSNEIHALDTALPGASLTTLGREQAGAAGRYQKPYRGMITTGLFVQCW